jgi:uncharacterized phage-associated protein
MFALNMRGFNYKKAVQALNFFAAKQPNRPFNNMKAIKLVWLSDRLHLRTFGRAITGDVYFAMPFGPVASTTLDLATENPYLSTDEIVYRNTYLEKFDLYHYKSIAAPVEKVFSKTDLQVMDTIQRSYGHLREFELSELSHSFPEWIRYKAALESKVSSRFLIDQDDFFIDVNDPAKVFIDDPDSLNITKDIYKEHQKLSLVF